jgi:uncharacterized protein
MIFKLMMLKKSEIFRIILILVVFLSGCQFGLIKEVVEVRNIQGLFLRENIVDSPGMISVKVEIADDEEERARGLMFRKKLRKNEGMLFVFEKESYPSFWMKYTLVPLDLMFISEDYEIVDIKQNFKPCNGECNVYTSKEKAKYVLEVHSGFVEENKVEIGDGIKHEGLYVYFRER